jgi:hypothetical protein
VAVAETTFPQLLPALTVRRAGSDSARTLMPLAYQQGVTLTPRAGAAELSYAQPAMDWVGARAPRADSSVQVRTHLRFAKGTMERADVLTPQATATVERVAMEYLLPAARASITAPAVAGGPIVVSFHESQALRWEVTGFGGCGVSVDR